MNLLKEKGWHITAFLFCFNGKSYIVLFEDLEVLKLVKGRNQVLLTFIDRDDEERMLRVKANERFFDIDAKKLRQFFGIEFSNRLGASFLELYEAFNDIIPDALPEAFESQMLDVVIRRLDENDGDSGRCCYCAAHNGESHGKKSIRSPFNTDKTRLLRPELFKLLGGDDTVSFRFREKGDVSDKDILERFRKRCARR